MTDTPDKDATKAPLPSSGGRWEQKAGKLTQTEAPASTPAPDTPPTATADTAPRATAKKEPKS